MAHCPMCEREVVCSAPPEELSPGQRIVRFIECQCGVTFDTRSGYNWDRWYVIKWRDKTGAVWSSTGFEFESKAYYDRIRRSAAPASSTVH